MQQIMYAIDSFDLRLCLPWCVVVCYAVAQHHGNPMRRGSCKGIARC